MGTNGIYISFWLNIDFGGGCIFNLNKDDNKHMIRLMNIEVPYGIREDVYSLKL